MKYIILDPWNAQVSDLPSVFECVYVDLECVAVQLRMVCRKQVQLTTTTSRGGGLCVLCLYVHSATLPLASPQSTCDN